jgi:hypothetical protein
VPDRPMSTPDIESKLAVFSVLGADVDLDTRSRFRFHWVRSWPTPSFSPLVLLPGERLEASDLAAVEGYFAEHPNHNRAVSDRPYFNFFEGDGLYDTGRIAALCAEHGWTIEDRPLAINLMHGDQTVALPAGHQVAVARFAERGLPDEYQALVRAGFRADDEYLSWMDRACAEAPADSYIVLLHGDAGVVAGGTVSVRGALGFLSWGTVGERHRNQGYHRLLLSVCRSAAAAAGGRISALTTRNAMVRGRCDEVVELYICRKGQSNGPGPRAGARRSRADEEVSP